MKKGRLRRKRTIGRQRVRERRKGEKGRTREREIWGNGDGKIEREGEKWIENVCQIQR